MQRRSSSDEQVISSSSAKYVRSYTCTFCKKGFSNAQALGGHMNIHRRDRAKLREERHNSKNSEGDGAGEDQEEMAGTVPSLLRLESKEEEEEDRGVVSKGKRAVIHGQDELLEPLPLFVDKPTPAGGSKEGKATSTSSVSVDRATEMDLELRLGIQPPVISIPRRKSL